MQIWISTLLRKGQDRAWIELGSRFMEEDNLWYVCVGHNYGQPQAPMSKSEADDEFHRRRDAYLAQGWKIVREVVRNDVCQEE
jgi:hypothetical protein